MSIFLILYHLISHCNVAPRDYQSFCPPLILLPTDYQTILLQDNPQNNRSSFWLKLLYIVLSDKTYYCFIFYKIVLRIHLVFFKFIYMCVYFILGACTSACTYVCVPHSCLCPWWLKEGTGYPKTVVIGICKVCDIGVSNQTQK